MGKHQRYVVMVNLGQEGWSIYKETSYPTQVDQLWLEAKEQYAGAEVVAFETCSQIIVSQVGIEKEKE